MELTENPRSQSVSSASDKLKSASVNSHGDNGTTIGSSAPTSGSINSINDKVASEIGNSQTVIVNARSSSDAFRETTGLTLWTGSLFILGEVAGGGILSLPNAIKGTGYIGVVLLIFLCCSSGYLGKCLGVCWVILEERYEKYRKGEKSPYSAISYEAYGMWMRYFVQFCNDLTMFGGGVVFLSLSASLFQSLVSNIWCVSPCYWQLIIWGVLLPLSWLGSPKDFWQMAVGASASIVIAAIMVFAECMVEADGQHDAYFPAPTFESFSLAFGAILFAFGGASAYPTIQNDMRDRTQFTKSIFVAFIGLMVIYLPVACGGYFVFGEEVKPDITQTLEQNWVTKTIQALVALHLLCAFVIVMNPVFQDFELIFKIPNGFGIRRVSARSVIMFWLLFISQSVPSFDKILNLIGGSTVTLTTFVLPPIFYMKLVSMKDPAWPKREIPLHERVFLWELIIVGVFGGTCATYSAIKGLTVADAFSKPCYLRFHDDSGLICPE